MPPIKRRTPKGEPLRFIREVALLHTGNEYWLTEGEAA